MAQSPEEMSPTARLAFGGLFAAAGLFIEAIAVGVISVDPESIHAPMWVIGLAGGMFTVTGAWIMSAGTPMGSILGKIVGPVVLVSLLTMLHWVAFGPGIRQCSGGVSIPFLSGRGPVGDFECRAAFGYGALLFDGLFAGTMLSRFAKERFEGVTLKIVDGFASALIFIPLLPFILVLVAWSFVHEGWKKLRAAARGGRGASD